MKKQSSCFPGHLLKRKDRNERKGALQWRPHDGSGTQIRSQPPFSVEMVCLIGFSAMDR